MAITDELRDYARHLHNVWYDPRGNVYTYTTMDNAPSLDAVRLDEHVLAIADRIDAEHESEISRAAQLLADAEKDRDFNYTNWQDCKQKVLHHNITIDELDAEIERLKDELANCAKLPKGVDGEYIHVGDVMEWVPYDDTYQPVIRTVSGVGADVFFAWNDEKCNYAQYDAQAYRHYKQQTVEDVLTDLCEHVWESALLGSTWSDSPVESYITEYAAKMRLAESEES